MRRLLEEKVGIRLKSPGSPSFVFESGAASAFFAYSDVDSFPISSTTFKWSPRRIISPCDSAEPDRASSALMLVSLLLA